MRDISFANIHANAANVIKKGTEIPKAEAIQLAREEV